MKPTHHHINPPFHPRIHPCSHDEPQQNTEAILAQATAAQAHRRSWRLAGRSHRGDGFFELRYTQKVRCSACWVAAVGVAPRRYIVVKFNMVHARSLDNADELFRRARDNGFFQPKLPRVKCHRHGCSRLRCDPWLPRSLCIRSFTVCGARLRYLAQAALAAEPLFGHGVRGQKAADKRLSVVLVGRTWAISMTLLDTTRTW